MVKAWIIKDKKRRNYFFLEEDRRRSLKIFSSLEDSRRWWTQLDLNKFPGNNASKTRIKSRCIQTGRSHSILKDFGISRLYFRRLYQKNQLPGISKASW
jgi:small subunit ribosomal protein S14